ncbi:MAG: class I SAM-dependent methyltransferase [bacterium]|nr:class I SAM-dependent methyltransferase [bacterium]
MKITDYSNIAKKYDGNRLRKDCSVCSELTEFVRRSRKKELQILDLGCGTGNFIKTHSELDDFDRIKWFGLDSSEEMLDIAKQKNPDWFLSFSCGNAEDIPHPDNFFDCIVCNFAFHHFHDKLKVLSEISRCLKGNGLLILKDIEPYSMEEWWVYKFFPSTFPEDKARFWQVNKIMKKLEEFNFKSEARLEKRIFFDDLKKIREDAVNRDISELTIISENEYNTGIKTIEKLQKTNKEILTENSILIITSKKMKRD